MCSEFKNLFLALSFIQSQKALNLSYYSLEVVKPAFYVTVQYKGPLKSYVFVTLSAPASLPSFLCTSSALLTIVVGLRSLDTFNFSVLSANAVPLHLKCDYYVE